MPILVVLFPFSRVDPLPSFASAANLSSGSGHGRLGDDALIELCGLHSLGAMRAPQPHCLQYLR